LHLLAVGVGLLVDHREITVQLGEEPLTRRPGTTPKVPGAKQITDDGLRSAAIVIARARIVAP
jgi:hypothetical protein